ncbi:phosphatase PAP2 family protein [Kribbella sp. NPDC055110]
MRGRGGHRADAGRRDVRAAHSGQDQSDLDHRLWPLGIAVTLGFVLFAGTLLDLVTRGMLRDWDHRVIPAARAVGAPEPVFWRALVDVGGVGFLSAVLIAAVLTHVLRRRRLVELVRAGAWILGIEIVIWLAKVSVGRTAPRSQLDELAAGDLSWPSGHAADALAILLIAATLLTRPGTILDRISFWAIPVIAAGVAIATVRLHNHWPTDAIGGWGLGLCLGSLARRSLRRNATSHHKSSTQNRTATAGRKAPPN